MVVRCLILALFDRVDFLVTAQRAALLDIVVCEGPLPRSDSSPTAGSQTLKNVVAAGSGSYSVTS